MRTITPKIIAYVVAFDGVDRSFDAETAAGGGANLERIAQGWLSGMPDGHNMFVFAIAAGGLDFTVVAVSEQNST